MNDLTAHQAGNGSHRWKFFRAGGFDQARLDSADDLFALGELDRKLWVALSCPVAGIEFPAETLNWLDADHDGHIRAPELIAAIDWCRERLADPEALIRGGSRLALSAIRGDTDAGRLLRRSAEQILANLGKTGVDNITIDDLADPTAIFGQTRFNGDGIVTARSTDDPTLRDAIAGVGETKGTRLDRCGDPGVDSEAVGAFFAEANAHFAWAAARPELPAGLDAVAAASAFAVVREKVDDYFARCRLAAYDGRAASFMNGSDDELAAVGRLSLAALPASLISLPLARVEAGRPLPLAEGINPAWSEAVAALRREAVAPLLGDHRDQLGEAEWAGIKTHMAALAGWFAARAEVPGTIDPATLRRWLDQGVEAKLLALIDQDLALADEAASIDEVGKLLFFVRDLAGFANNFVSFRDFYTRQGYGMFQAGTLYLDGRACELVISVDDVGAHGALAALGKLYLVYCVCRRGADTRHIVAAMTDGESDQLVVGRNGVWVDRQGLDWDARIVRIIDNPISLRQAFWAPYRRVARMVGEQVQKFAANRAAAVEQKAAAALIENAGKKPGAAPAAAGAPPQPVDIAKYAGIFAALGLALGALGTAAAALVTGFLGLKGWQMPLAIGGVLLLISGPSLVIAWFKLRSRTLGPLLDANGWAINARAAINLPFGRSLTQMPKLPAGATRSLADPYAEKRTPWGWYLGFAVLAILLVGYFAGRP